MDSNKKYILVTGGAGYIGSHTVVALVEKGYTPIIIDDFRNSNRDVIYRLEKITKEEIIFFDAACQDAMRLKGIFSQFPVYGIIHFAADKAVGESMEEPLKYFNNNFGSLISMLELAKEFEIKRFVFSSSCTVYGEPENIPVNEQSPVSYSSPYGFTKKVCEEMIQQFVASCPFVRSTLLRYFNPVGAHESGIIGEEPDGKPNNLLPFITQTAAGVRKELTVFGDDYDTPDGTCIRDYIHVVDLAEAHVAALENTDNSDVNPMVYNVGTGTGTSVLEMIQTFESITGIKLPYTIGPRRDGDIKEIFANTDKVNKELNWKSKKNITDAISSAWTFEKYIRELRKNE
jgi:UDP-glucose 4-epimerase